ncbi:MAG: hypothetical protein OXG72_09895 [Acidobacteria bacterium]|nr:hypothetical protein [Acidobacteriota bacterium]
MSTGRVLRRLVRIASAGDVIGSPGGLDAGSAIGDGLPTPAAAYFAGT